MIVRLLEAMSKGIPVIAPKTGGIPYLLSDENNRFLYKVGSVEKLANALVASLKVSESVKGAIIKSNLRKLSEEYSADMFLLRILEVYS